MAGNIAHSHEEAEEWDLRFWLAQGPQQRLSALVDIHRDIAKVRAGRTRPTGPNPEADEHDL